MEEKKRKILVAEDSVEILDLITLHLEEKYTIYRAFTGKEAVSILQETSIDLVILDIMLPVLNGYEVMKQIRENHNIPIIIVSAKTSDVDKIIGLKKGADDYLPKPFNPLELSARVEAQLRRFYKWGGADDIAQEIIEIANLRLDCAECCLYKDDIKILLTSTEYKLLKLLMGYPGRIFTKKEIFEKIWEEEYMYDNNAVMVYISKLREHIEEDSKKPKYIATVRGLGYKFEKQ